MPVQEGVKQDFEAEVEDLKQEIEQLKKTNESLNKTIQEVTERYTKLFNLFANNIDFYLGNK